MHGYLSWRITTLHYFRTPQRKHRFWILSLGIWLTYLIAIQLRHGSQGSLTSLLEQLALDWLGVLFIATTVMLALELLTGFGLWAKRYHELLRRGGLLLALLLIAIALMQGGRPPVVIHHEVTLDALPHELDGTRLVALSDLHLGSQFGPHWFAARVAQVERLQPDLILLLGDLFEGHNAPDGALQPLFARLKAPLGVYAVTGNHEFHGESGSPIAMSEAGGVTWLRNRTQHVAAGLLLVGIDNLRRKGGDGDNSNPITPLLKGESGGATLLLSHSPLKVEENAAAGISLMLSGHTHGGQIWPFSYLVAHYYPYLAGRYQIDDMTLIVSRGTGLWGPRMRLWQPAEIIEVTLRARPREP